MSSVSSGVRRLHMHCGKPVQLCCLLAKGTGHSVLYRGTLRGCKGTEPGGRHTWFGRKGMLTTARRIGWPHRGYTFDTGCGVGVCTRRVSMQRRHCLSREVLQFIGLHFTVLHMTSSCDLFTAFRACLRVSCIRVGQPARNAVQGLLSLGVLATEATRKHSWHQNYSGNIPRLVAVWFSRTACP